MDLVARTAATCCLGLACECYRNALSVQNGIVTRVIYVVLLLVLATATGIFFFWGYQIVSYIPLLSGWICSRTDTHDACNAVMVYRVMMAFMLFFISLALAQVGSKGKDDIRAGLQNRLWSLKFPYLALLFVGCVFFVPQWAISLFSYVACGAAFLFVLAEVFYVVSFAFEFFEWAAFPDNSVEEESRTCLKGDWLAVVVFLTFSMLGLSIGLGIYAGYILEDPFGCSINVFVGVIWVGTWVVTISVSVSDWARSTGANTGIFHASVVIMYSTFLAWNTLVVSNQSECATHIQFDDSVYVLTVSIGTFFAAGLSLFSTLPAKMKPGEVEISCETYNYARSNLLFALACAYIAMQGTNWTLIDIVPGNGIDSTVTHTVASTVSSGFILSMMLLVCVYFTPLFSRRMFPERNFDQEYEEEDDEREPPIAV